MKIQTSIKLPAFTVQFVSLLLLMLFFSAASIAQTVEKIDYLVEGDMLPQFNIPMENGTIISSATLANKVVVLSFFATWCGPCLKELPHLQSAIWEINKSNPNFELLVIGREHTSTELAQFKAEHQYTFPIIADTKREIFSVFAKQNIPRMYLIDRTGKIILMTEGFEEKKFKSFVNKLDAELQK